MNLPATAGRSEYTLLRHVPNNVVFYGNMRQYQAHIFLDYVSIAIEIISRVREQSDELKFDCKEDNLE
jgi:hypothetical protein